MATNGLGCLIMTAVVDPTFRDRLLAAPSDVIDDFELTDDERQVMTSIQARSLAEFAAQLHRWLAQRDPLHFGVRGANGSDWSRKELDDAPTVEGRSTANGTGREARVLSDSRTLYGGLAPALRPHDDQEGSQEEPDIALPVPSDVG